ncbi:DUF5624 domain-containing protein [Variovorax rhizosphaerae]|uniref:DUF5624 domain-containing protein n=1 Tax=Variovorax rhizosphaerae TaxID=1836200 RepID=A0ABU8WI58_9BURK
MDAPSPFLQLFTAYVGQGDSIGGHLSQQVAAEVASAPLVLVTGTAIALFRGDGQPPELLDTRFGTKGFNELAGISHLGPALGSIVAMAEAGNATWQGDAQRLSAQVAAAQKANTVAFWADIGVPSWAPHLEGIQRMVAYACDLALAYLAALESDPSRRTFDALVSDVLEVRSERFPVPLDHVMLATFCLTALNGTQSSLSFLRGLKMDWTRALVVLTAGNGGATAALTRCTNHLVDTLVVASRGAVRQDRMFIIPTAPTSTQPADWAASEARLRGLWATTYARTKLAARMFPGYPRLAPAECADCVATPATRTVAVPPRPASAEDLWSFVARLRFVMEDPTQLLSSVVASYVIGQLATGTKPEDVPIPGLAGVSYPRTGAFTT